MYKKFYFLVFMLISQSLLAFSQSPQMFDVPSGDFPDLTSVVSYINQHGPGDNGLVFTIAGGSVFDEPQLVINASGTEQAKIVIQWDGQNEKPVVNFSGSTAGGEAGIILEGARYIIIDGIDIHNPDGLLEYGIFITNADGETGSQNNIIRNTNITLNKSNPNETNAVRVFAQYNQTSHNGSNSNNSFLNNHVSNMSLGYVINSNTGTVELMDTGNIVGTAEGGEHIIEDLVFCGVYMLNQNGATIDGVTIRNLYRPDDGTNIAPAAISTSGAFPSGPLTHPMVISNNRIEDQYTDGTTIFGMYLNQRNVHNEVYNNIVQNVVTEAGGNTYASGIFLFATGSTANIYNNMVADVAAPVSTANFSSGIYVRTFEAANIYFNTVRLGYIAGASDNKSASLYIHNNSDPVEMKNNIFVNKTTFMKTGTGFAAAFYKNTSSLSNISSATDNNIYYGGTPSPLHLIFAGGSEHDQTLEAYQARASTFDQGSFTEDVPFHPGMGLYVDPLAGSLVRENAMPISSPVVIDTDIDGKLRDTENPDIGAAELPNPYPAMATDPQPQHQQQDVPVTVPGLQWQFHPDQYFVDPAGFHVYMGTDELLRTSEYLGWVPYNPEQTDFSIEINNENGLEYQTEYFWQVVPTAVNEDGAGAPDAAVWSFTTEMFTYDYPNTAANPSPGNESTEVSLELDQLSWEFFPDPAYTLPAGFHIYLGTTAQPGEDELLGWIDFIDGEQQYLINITEVELLPLTQYFWKVVPSTDQNEGPVNPEAEIWNFTTEAFFFEFPNPAQTPTPADGEVEVSVLLNDLSWMFIPEADYISPAGFHVYLGTSQTFSEADHLGWVEFDPEQENYTIALTADMLLPLTQYFWQVLPSADMEEGPVAADASVWSFTTEDDTSVGEPGENLLRVFPNPAKSYLTISLMDKGKFEILSLDGRITDRGDIAEGTNRISVSHLSRGSYLLRITTDKNVQSRIIVIKK